MAKGREFFKFVRQLSNVRRYSRDFSVRDENVLEHAGFCVLYCLNFVQRNDLDVDLGALLRKAALHDLEEAVLGDINRQVKYANADVRKEISHVENAAAMKICMETGFAFDDWNHAKEGPEGKIVALSDYAAVVFHVANEIYTLNNNSFIRVRDEAASNLSKAIHAEDDPVFLNELGFLKAKLLN